jgi:Cu2+-exporting ATPase
MNALAARSSYLQLAERAARLYAPMVHVTAALTLVGWLAVGASLHDSIITAIAVLIITCPCAIALAVPAVQVVASGALLRAGIILKSRDAIERLAEVDTVVFDKTGTLTLPEQRIANAPEIDPDLLDNAARLALSSRHPLAVAVAMEARQRIPFDGAVEDPGRGVHALVNGAEARLGSPEFCGLPARVTSLTDPPSSVIAFSHAGRTALLEISQRLRPDAEVVAAGLRKHGVNIFILSGDRPAAVAPVAASLGVPDWRAGVSPVDKIAFIDELKARGRRVLMVGDGLNDAPALAAAHVSLSPISAAQLAQAHADAVFLGDRLRPVLEAVAIARRARALMRQNLWLAAAYNAVAVPIAIAGLITPLIAAAAMSGSSLLVTVNALRARGRRNSAAPKSTGATVPEEPRPA